MSSFLPPSLFLSHSIGQTSLKNVGFVSPKCLFASSVVTSVRSRTPLFPCAHVLTSAIERPVIAARVKSAERLKRGAISSRNASNALRKRSKVGRIVRRRARVRSSPGHCHGWRESPRRRRADLVRDRFVFARRERIVTTMTMTTAACISVSFSPSWQRSAVCENMRLRRSGLIPRAICQSYRSRRASCVKVHVSRALV